MNSVAVKGLLDYIWGADSEKLERVTPSEMWGVCRDLLARLTRDQYEDIRVQMGHLDHSSMDCFGLSMSFGPLAGASHTEDDLNLMFHTRHPEQPLEGHEYICLSDFASLQEFLDYVESSKMFAVVLGHTFEQFWVDHRRPFAEEVTVRLDRDVASVFPDSESVNRALRMLLDLPRRKAEWNPTP